MKKFLSKVSTASRIAREGGAVGPYETLMYRYFWPLGKRISQNGAKHWEEFRYWKRQAASGRLGNSWYQRLFTDPFGLSVSDYHRKRILDIGCGPRGSLEWAGNTSERVGLDPLVAKYRRFGIDGHAISYVEGRSEKIPFEDNYFDYVACINALDHVDDVLQTLSEIVRVLRPGGRFLLMVDIGHDPTLSEPHRLSWDALDGLRATCDALLLERFEQQGSAAESVMSGTLINEGEEAGREGVLLAMLMKRPKGIDFSSYVDRAP